MSGVIVQRAGRTNVSTTTQLKRVCEEPSLTNGERILVERLWPRGLTRAQASVDLWMKEVVPSPERRKWFTHDPAKWKQFVQRYWMGLRSNQDAADQLRCEVTQAAVTFVYAARDERHNGATALKEFLEGQLC